MKHLESQLQQACVTWARLQYPELRVLLTSVPNGVRTSVIQAKIAKAEGLVAGTSDLLLLIPRGKWPYLCIEMKTKTGRLSDHQKIFRDHVESVGGRYEVVRSLEQFMDLVNEYMNL